MPISPASQHRARVEAALYAAREAEGAVLSGTGRGVYEMMLEKLRKDINRLSRTKSVRNKAHLKRELIPEYADYINSVLRAEHSPQDNVLVRVMLWSIDADDFEYGLRLAAFALDNDMVMGGGFERDLPDVLAEEMATKALHHDDPASLTAAIATTLSLLKQRDLMDEVSAKLHKAMGLCLEQSDPETALRHFETALKFNSTISVRRNINRLKKQLEQNQ